ncbi:hypothetical protein RQP46_003517 [Phenoliferia psychrophenolica]
MANYSITPLAYLKVILHAAKWHGTVTGLLVGTYDAATKNAVVQDAIPLLHHWTDLSPMMEAGLQLAEIHAKAQGQIFLGLYVANEGVDDTTVPASTAAVADAMRKEFPQTLIVVVDNAKLGAPASPLLSHLSSGSAWAPTSSPLTLSDPTSPLKALEQVRAGKQTALGDFDEHVEDVKVDWLKNAAIVP